MARLTITVGVLLVVLGAGAYFMSGRESVTALIPAFFGVAIGLCGIATMRPPLARGALIVAAGIAILGFVGSLARIVPKLVKGEQIEMNLASGAQIAMAVVTAVYAVLAVRGIAGRSRSRRQG